MHQGFSGQSFEKAFVTGRVSKVRVCVEVFIETFHKIFLSTIIGSQRDWEIFWRSGFDFVVRAPMNALASKSFSIRRRWCSFSLSALSSRTSCFFFSWASFNSRCSWLILSPSLDVRHLASTFNFWFLWVCPRFFLALALHFRSWIYVECHSFIAMHMIPGNMLILKCQAIICRASRGDRSCVRKWQVMSKASCRDRRSLNCPSCHARVVVFLSFQWDDNRSWIFHKIFIRVL